MQLRRASITFCAAISLALVSTLLAVANVYLTVREIQGSKPKTRSYCKQMDRICQSLLTVFAAYLGEDYPEFYIPADGELPLAMMTMEESRHYAVTGPDALDEWASGSPVGYGYLRLGEESRGFSLAMFHELHCLHVMRLPLDGVASPHNLGHMQHCLNYLRQFILCSPNLTLEPADVLTRDFEEDREGATHVCRNWEVMYDEMAENWREWEPVRNRFNQTSGSATSGPI